MKILLIIFASVLLSVGPSMGQIPGGPMLTITEMILMRDGLHLATDVYLPKKGQGPWPTLLVRTPYNKNLYNIEYGSLAARSYAVVVQDMRGRFGSEGVDLAFFDCGWGERQDGVDTIRWIVRQKWSNGKVGTLGASAMGITQNMLAGAAPENLVAQYILVAAGSLYHHGAYTDGAVRLEQTMGYLLDNAFDPMNIWLTILHPMYDEHWLRFDAIAEAGKANVPAVHYGGWYDAFLAGTVDTFMARQERGGPGARGRQKLIIGPWCHGGPGTEAKPKRTGELLFPSNSRRLPHGLVGMKWFDHYLQGKANGAEKAPAAMYYTMGAIDEPGAPGNLWRMDDVWPPKADAIKFYLRADGLLSRKRSVKNEASQTFTFNPYNPVPTRGGGNLCIPSGIFDQRVIERRPDVLVFSSESLTKAIEVTGPVTSILFVSSNCPDTDFAVKLCDVYPAGQSMNVCDGLLRVRHRNGVDRLDLLKPGEIVSIRVDLVATSMIFNKGHRIRIHVTSSNYPRFDVNPNTGWPAWSFCPVQIAHNTIHCSASHASFIELPVVYRPSE
ncbi:MAG: CocE/NonD family hydrolase [Planctomycetota bacterium]|nr:MAG: CocE/NonD family hydrolase [Planctomycetota bacterium]